MRLRTKFALVISACVLIYFCFTTFVLTQLFTSEQELNLNDFQSSLSIFSKRTLEMRMSLLYSQLEPLIQEREVNVGELLSKIRGGLNAEMWKNGVLQESTVSVAHIPPPAGETAWVLTTSPSPHAVRWVGRYGPRVLVIDFRREWFDGVLESTHGAFSQIVQADGTILMESNSGAQGVEHRKRLFDSKFLEKMALGPAGIPQTRRYQSDDGANYVGTFLILPTAPPLMITMMTPWETIQKVIDGIYLRSARLAAAFLIAAIVIGIGFASTLTAPLQTLVDQTVLVAKGDLKHRLTQSSRRKDEVGILGRAFDRMVTELDRLQSELRRTERLAALGQFSASLTHELKNPLANISANEQLLEMKLKIAERPEDTGINQALKFIKEEAKRANGIVVNLMKFARQEKAPTILVDLTQIVRRSFTLLQTTVNGTDVTLVELVAAQPIHCFADADQIHEVLANLVGNAIHACRDRPEKRVTVSLERKEELIYIRVTDTGSGIPPDVKEHIFEPFFTTKKIGEGTGLGLAVCHGIITSHGGKIEVDSQPGEGTRFTIVLPSAEKGVEGATAKAA